MTNETKRRIAHYQKSLPAMREKVLGAVLMLFIAVLTAVCIALGVCGGTLIINALGGLLL